MLNFRKPIEIGRNEPCPCGSALKYKRCCLDKDVSERREAALFVASHVDFADKMPLLCDQGALPLYPWMKTGYQGVGVHKKQEA